MGTPLAGSFVWGQTIISDEVTIWQRSEVDENGFYQFWSMNGAELTVWNLVNNQWNTDTFMLNATLFDDGLDAYVFNYNIEPLSYTALIEGYAFTVEYNEIGDPDTTFFQDVAVFISNLSYVFEVYTDADGYFSVEVPASNYGIEYYMSVDNMITGFTNYDYYETIYAYTGASLMYEIQYYPVTEYYTISGYVFDENGQPIYDAMVELSGVDENMWWDYSWSDSDGYYSITAPSGIYDLYVSATGFLNQSSYGFDLSADATVDFTMMPVVFTGSVQGVVSLVGEYASESVYINVYNDTYDAYTYADENGFYTVDLVDGIYDIYVDAMGYNSYFMSQAFEISGNTVIYDVELFEYGYAGAPNMVNLHDVPNDQGRQMRAVWDAGMPGDWEYFTQFSIWRKVNNAPIELWDYIETVPWHGMDPYAAVVPTLGDSSMHGMHMSTFMVTAHTDDISVWLDSEPMSGYSIDNLHPMTPMSLSFSTNPGSVSLSWSGSVDEDFSYFNVYRQDITSNEPAMIFTTTDSFYVDQAMEDVGAYEYWVTAVDLSGLESESSSIVSAVLSSEDELGMPTEFALKQNYPNPFNPSTQIQYALPSETRVVISIYDITGRKVRTLVNEVQSAGYRTVMWNATNEIGRPVSAGMYIYTIQAGDFIQNRKMVLMK